MARKSDPRTNRRAARDDDEPLGAAAGPDGTSIAAYAAKRDFAATAEPPPGPALAREGQAVFVVQRHEARRLHYDLRLEMEGVLKSFAVPKGFSWDPSDKHLAVRTEDHPLEYFDFEGVIPKGSYGAGTMTIWDRGTYSVRKGDGPSGLAGGKLEIAFGGGRLRGEWHMVKTARAENDWLLFKHRDRYARPPREPLFPISFLRVPEDAFPEAPRAMKPRGKPPELTDPEWLFELDFTGHRMLAGRDGGPLWWGADGRRMSLSLPGVARGLESIRSERFVMDGVLVATDDGGRPSRPLLDERLASGDTGDLAYYAFDLLFYEDWSLVEHPLAVRKRALESIIPKGIVGVMYVDHVAGRGDEMLAIVGASGLPGVIAKAKESPYTPGPSGKWRRVAAAANADAGRHVLDSLAAPGSERVIHSRAKLSNLDKVYWPGEGITKGQLLDYYDRMAETVLPYLRDRPVHMLRYPEGIEGHAFYQKNVAELVPDWVPTVPVSEKDGEDVRYVVCNDRDTLLYLVNLGSIDLHPWMSRVGSLDSPDYLVIDLDPSTDEFPPVVKIARELGKILRGIGMRPLLKTSGASGLHVHLALKPGYSYEQARMFAELVARLVSKEQREIATVERTVAKRGRKVYVDYGQNAREQTVVPPYVVRPKPGATVSTPLDWDELDEDLRRESFTIFSVPERVERLGDLYGGLLDDPHDLMEALGRLQAQGG